MVGLWEEIITEPLMVPLLPFPRIVILVRRGEGFCKRCVVFFVWSQLLVCSLLECADSTNMD
jgi:hypothetical protein